MVTIYAGIDVAARSVELALRQNGRRIRRETFAQTPDGHRQLQRRLQTARPQRVVLEATGVYYLDLAVTLAHAPLPVSVINPRSFHHFAKLKLQGSKTDGIDADLLAEYSERLVQNSHYAAKRTPGAIFALRSGVGPRPQRKHRQEQQNAHLA